MTDTKEEWLTSATTKTTRVENKAEPAANPSKPSMRLKALVIPMTQKTVNTKPSTPLKCLAPKNNGTAKIRSPPRNNIAPAIPWTANFIHGRAPRKSSYTPSRKTRQAGTSIVVAGRVETLGPHLGKYGASNVINASVERKAAQMATPPSRGSGSTCMCRSGEGRATQPLLKAKSRTNFVRMTESSSAKVKAPR